MSQFAFANELKNCVRMDEPITKGPIPRWQKKCIEASNLRFAFAILRVTGTNVYSSKFTNSRTEFCRKLVVTLEELSNVFNYKAAL
jgi:cell division cycle protein 20 (cofactor of APC complex)